MPDVHLDADTLVSCDADGVCPGDWTCVSGTCRPKDYAGELPVVTLAYSLPEDGDSGVSLLPTVVLAFSLPVAPESLDARVHLSGGGTDAPLHRLDEGSGGTTFRFKPTAALIGATLYELRLDDGIAPAVIGADPSAGVVLVRFTTRPGDLEPPLPVSGLVVERRSDSHVHLSWTKPSDADYGGALILRQAEGPIVDAPTSGVVYSAGSVIGAAEVLTTTVHDAWDDLTVGAGLYDYAVFAFDSSINYSRTDARAPRLAAEAMTWCSDETSVFTVSALDAHTPSVWVGTNTPFDLGMAAPAPNGTLDATALVVTGVDNTWRSVLAGERGTAVGKPNTFFAAPGMLPVTKQPYGIGTGGSTFFAVSPSIWPGLTGEVDTSPVPSFEQWMPLAVSPTGSMSAPFAAPGEYKFRVRPVLPGCAPGAWTTSDAFTVGRFLYVAQGGRGAKTGVDPENAMATITGAIAAASGPTGQTTIYVAQGTYAGPITLKSRVDLYGSYDADFTARTLLPEPTSVLTASSTVVTAGASASAVETILSGFSVEPAGTTGDIEAITLSNGARVSLEDSRVVAADTTGNYSKGIFATGVNLRCVRSSILLGHGTQDSHGVIAQSSTVSLDRCSISPRGPLPRSSPVALDACDTVIDRSYIYTGAAALQDFAIDAYNGGSLRLTNSVVHALPAVGNSVAITAGGLSPCLITNNTVIGANNQPALSLTNTAAVVTNNLVLSDGTLDACVENTTPAVPVTVQNNAFTQCGGALVRGGATAYQALCPGGAIGVSGGCVTTLAASADNVTVGSAAALGLTADYHLSNATPAAVQSGGRDASMTSACNCGAVGLDHDGTPRTCSAVATCYSIGAFERDP